MFMQQDFQFALTHSTVIRFVDLLEHLEWHELFWTDDNNEHPKEARFLLKTVQFHARSKVALIISLCFSRGTLGHSLSDVKRKHVLDA